MKIIDILREELNLMEREDLANLTRLRQKAKGIVDKIKQNTLYFLYNAIESNMTFEELIQRFPFMFFNYDGIEIRVGLREGNYGGFFLQRNPPTIVINDNDLYMMLFSIKNRVRAYKNGNEEQGALLEKNIENVKNFDFRHVYSVLVHELTHAHDNEKDRLKDYEAWSKLETQLKSKFSPDEVANMEQKFYTQSNSEYNAFVFQTMSEFFDKIKMDEEVPDFNVLKDVANNVIIYYPDMTPDLQKRIMKRLYLFWQELKQVWH